MEIPDKIPMIRAPYSQTFRLWGSEGRTFKQHDLVPSVGMAETYAVLLSSREPFDLRFVTVQEHRITNLMAHQPIEKQPVFDTCGRYLGMGGEPLEDLQGSSEDTSENPPPAPQEEARPSHDPPPTPLPQCEPAHTHRFWLRENLEVQFTLPVNLTKEEAQRISTFVTTLPTTVEQDG